MQKLDAALNTPGAIAFYFLGNNAERRDKNLRLGREIGYGLRDYPPNEIRPVLNTLYGRFIVKRSLDTTGVCISNGEFIAQVLSQFGPTQRTSLFKR